MVVSPFFRVHDLIQRATMDSSMPMSVKEAVYLAAGITAFHLFEELDFDDLFRLRLWNEFQHRSPE